MKVAVIGGGVSGISAIWALNEFSDHEVHLFESGAYIGGHTNTVTYHPTAAASKDARKELQPVKVDTGFIVFNTATYPNFLRFVKYIGAEILESDMSFSVSRWGIPRLPSSLTFFASLFPTILNGDGSRSRQTLARPGETGDAIRGWFEWAGSSPAALFCQATNLVDPSHWRMIWDVIRFNSQSLETLRAFESGKVDREEAAGSIGQWLDKRNYGHNFRRNYLIPMTASIWSTPPSLAFDAFPAVTLLRFMHNHHLLQILNRPQWLTLKGGSQTYVGKVLKSMPSRQLHHDAEGGGRVVKVEPVEDGSRWRVISAGGHEDVFDKLIFATHADTALKLLDGSLVANDARRDALASFGFSHNEAVLHGDARLMPLRREAWSAWNFIAVEQSPPKTKKAGVAIASARDADRVSLTYWMNLLQSLPESQHGHVLVTLNPPTGEAAPRPELVAGKYSYEHPIYTARSVASQRALAPLQGKDGVFFAGAWLNYGFHEDGFSSGLRAAESLGARLPFDVRSAERAVPKRDVALLVISLIESLRALISPWLLLVSYPIVVALTLGLESLVNAAVWAIRGSGAKCGIRNELRRIRVDWESLKGRKEPGGGGNESWIKAD
ncbi:unnamed protein product [Parajaminaea phylloscopi]